MQLLCGNYFTVYLFGQHIKMKERSLKQLWRGFLFANIEDVTNINILKLESILKLNWLTLGKAGPIETGKIFGKSF